MVVRANRTGGRTDKGITLSHVNRGDAALLHEQVAAAIRRAIADGEARPGERIPKAQDLAAVLGVNTNTVLRALRLLRDEGLLELGRGRAITVTGGSRQAALADKVRELLAAGRREGYELDELVKLLRAMA
jgi:GntR family transcriptional regulator